MYTVTKLPDWEASADYPTEPMFCFHIEEYQGSEAVTVHFKKEDGSDFFLATERDYVKKHFQKGLWYQWQQVT